MSTPFLSLELTVSGVLGSASIHKCLAGVSFCEVDFQVSLDTNSNMSATPDDPHYPQQWDLLRVKTALVWALGYLGTSAVRVCMIDSGIDYNHPDIAANVWINPAEASGANANFGNGYMNSIDDDGNSRFFVLIT